MSRWLVGTKLSSNKFGRVGKRRWQTLSARHSPRSSGCCSELSLAGRSVSTDKRSLCAKVVRAEQSGMLRTACRGWRVLSRRGAGILDTRYHSGCRCAGCLSVLSTADCRHSLFCQRTNLRAIRSHHFSLVSDVRFGRLLGRGGSFLRLVSGARLFAILYGHLSFSANLR